jgi:uncharacterized protein (TIGR00369 family)
MTTPDESPTALAPQAQSRCFGCGPASTTGLHLVFLPSEDGSVSCQTAIPEAFEGPPGYIHGGIIATMLDEAMSKSVRALGKASMTRQLEVDYLRPVPSGAPIRIHGHLVRGEGRKHWAEATIQNAAGKVLAQSKGLFVEMRER